VRVKVVKNKVAPPFKQAEFDIMYGTGFSWEGTVLDVALDRKIVTKSGSYFSFGDERLGQGRQNATAFLREHPDVTQQILQRLQLEVGPEQVVSARLLPLLEEPSENGAGGSGAKAAKAAAAAAAIAEADAEE
jgi:recombination protein RecA